MSTTAIIPSNPTPPAVTLVTAFAATADLSDGEYRAIYDRLADGRSLRNIELALHSGVSYAWWGKYASGEKTLDLDRKNELRVWAGLPPIPPTPAAAVAAAAHPDAAVYYVGTTVGTQIATRVVMIGADVPAVNLRLNGNCTVVDSPALPYTPHVTGVTGHSRPRSTKSLSVRRETWQRLNSRRVTLGLTWDEFLCQIA